MKNNKGKGALQELGLSPGAERAYLNLIESGPQLISDIARQSGQFRVDTYRFIDELIEHKLAKTVRQGKRKYYEAASPESIFSILKAKEDKVADEVTDMLAIFDRQQKGFSIQSFAGKKGLEATYEVLVKDAAKNAELLRIEALRDYHMPKEYYPKIYAQRAFQRNKGDIQKVVITNAQTHATRRRALNRMSKAVPAKYSPFAFEYSTIIIEDKVAIIDYEHERSMVITDKRFASYMRSIFKMLYEKL